MRKIINIVTISMLYRSLLVVTLFLSFTVASFAQLNTNRLMSIGRNALYFEDYVLSIQYFNQIIKIRPYQDEPYFFRALAKFYLDDYQGAINDCNVCLDINPYFPKAYHLRGDILLRTDNFVKAIENYDKVITYDSKNSIAYLNRGISKQSSEQYAEAITDFTKAIELRGGLLNAFLARGGVYLSLGDTTTALKDFDNVVEINPYYTPGLATRGLLYYKLNRFQDAFDDYDKAVALSPDKPGYYTNRALIRYQLNDLKGAMDDYNKVIEIDASNSLAFFNRGLLRAQIGDDNNALQDFTTVISIEPDNYMAIFNRSLLYKKLGNYRLAIADLNTIISEYPNFPPAYYARSQVKEKLNDAQGAQRDYNTAYVMERDNRKLSDSNKEVLASNSAIKSTQKKETRNKSNNDMRNYKKIVVLSEEKEKEKTGFDSEIRGKVQNRNIVIDLQEIFYLSVFEQNFHLDRLYYFSDVVSKFSQNISKNGQLFLVNSNRKLEQTDIDKLFLKINDISLKGDNDRSRSEWLVYQGIHQGLVKNYIEAIETFDQSIKLDITNALAYFERANARYKMEQFIRSVEDVSETDITISLTSNASPKATNKDINAKSLNIELVLRDLSKTIELNPTFAFAWYNRANVRVASKDYMGALRDYSEAIRLNPEMGESYYNRGLTLIYVGQEKDGIKSLSKAGELGLYNAYNVLKRYSSDNSK